jgi:mRNA interferase MazF
VVDIPRQGEIWWVETGKKRRPVLVVTRSAAIGVLRTIVVAPVTRTVRPIPTHLVLGSDDGLDRHCAAAFDNLQVVPRALLTERLGRLSPGRRAEFCDTMKALTDC